MAFRDDFTQETNGYGVQGDVPIVKRDKLPENASPIPGNILRAGEVTGHHHTVVAEPGAFQLYRVPTSGGRTELWMELFQDAKVSHEEHGTLTFPAGIYVVPEQVEYDGSEERRVID